MGNTASSGMSIDILRYQDDVFKCKDVQEVDSFVKYKMNPEQGIDTNALICYVVLLYSVDTFLKKKPMPRLPERQLKAAELSGLNAGDELIKKLVFDLGSEKISGLIVDYLISQNSYDWSDRCATEAQMEENLRIRMRAVESDKGDKDLIEAFTKKYVLTNHFTDYKEKLRKLDDVIFSDHDKARDQATRQRVSIETVV